MLNQVFQDEVAKFVPEWMKELVVPGVALAVINDGRLAWSQGFGTVNAKTGNPVTADTIFEAASLSKPVVACAALQLVDKGILELDRPLIGYLPDGRIPVTLPQGIWPSQYATMEMPLLEQITARHVLKHATGLPNWPPAEGELAIHFLPGSRFSYSGMAYGMIQTMIELLSGQPCLDYIQNNIFTPFGMTRSTFIWNGEKDWSLAVGHDENGEPVEKSRWPEMIAGAGLHCSTADFARFLAVVLHPQADSPFQLSAESAAEMIRPHIQVNDSAPWHSDWPKTDFTVNPNVGWGLGWGTQQSKEGGAVWHWGDNDIYQSFVLGYPDRGTGLVIMTNSKNGVKLYQRILRDLVGGDYPSLDWLDSL
ncbi:MAG: serine hydrolase domain-containing protein [Candidatus Promineifilaceae bacterium]